MVRKELETLQRGQCGYRQSWLEVGVLLAVSSSNSYISTYMARNA
jgi:hypothetical protein